MTTDLGQAIRRPASCPVFALTAMVGAVNSILLHATGIPDPETLVTPRIQSGRHWRPGMGRLRESGPKRLSPASWTTSGSSSGRRPRSSKRALW